jgi:hypothetical protein
MLADPDRWPLLHLNGGVVVFGWRDPGRKEPADPFYGHEVDLDRLAFRPTEAEKAPPAPARDADPRWWDAFWRPAPPQRSADRDEASVLLLKADAIRRSALERHLTGWEAAEVAGLTAVGAGPFGPAGPTDAALRLTLFRPPLPPGWKPGGAMPPISQLVIALQRHAAWVRG